VVHRDGVVEKLDQLGPGLIRHGPMQVEDVGLDGTHPVPAAAARYVASGYRASEADDDVLHPGLVLLSGLGALLFGLDIGRQPCTPPAGTVCPV
jgi:hypothetical protein